MSFDTFHDLYVRRWSSWLAGWLAQLGLAWLAGFGLRWLGLLSLAGLGWLGLLGLARLGWLGLPRWAGWACWAWIGWAGWAGRGSLETDWGGLGWFYYRGIIWELSRI